MELQITARNMELTPPVRGHIERKLGKLSRHLPHIIESRVEIAQEKTKSPEQHFVARVTVAGDGARFHSEGRGEDLFQAIDRVADTIIRQLEHHKGKHQEKGRISSPARDKSGEETETAKPAPEVVKVKRFLMKPMTVAEAAHQMELLGHSFFLFFNADTEELNLLYQRKDGNYGLIEPELG